MLPLRKAFNEQKTLAGNRSDITTSLKDQYTDLKKTLPDLFFSVQSAPRQEEVNGKKTLDQSEIGKRNVIL